MNNQTVVIRFKTKKAYKREFHEELEGQIEDFFYNKLNNEDLDFESEPIDDELTAEFNDFDDMPIEANIEEEEEVDDNVYTDVELSYDEESEEAIIEFSTSLKSSEHLCSHLAFIFENDEIIQTVFKISNHKYGEEYLALLMSDGEFETFDDEEDLERFINQ